MFQWGPPQELQEEIRCKWCVEFRHQPFSLPLDKVSLRPNEDLPFLWKNIFFSGKKDRDGNVCNWFLFCVDLPPSSDCTMGEIGLLNVTQEYFITFFWFGTTFKFNYLLCVYSYWRINYIFVMATNLTLMQQFLTLFNPILAKWQSFAHSAMSPLHSS